MSSTGAANAPDARAPMGVPLLAIDTSTSVMAVAAAGPRGTCTLNLPGAAAASSHLLPGIERALREVGGALAQLEAIAYGQGPGAFTGLRTSVAVAQGLGLGLCRRLLPIDSLLIVAEDARAAGAHAAQGWPRCGRIAVAMDARMDEIYGAVYEWEPSHARALGESARPIGWRTVRAAALYTLAAWNAVLRSEGSSLCALAGSALEAFGPRLEAGAMRRMPQEDNRAGALLRLAAWAHEDGAGVEPHLALPLYLRDKVALTTAEREAARAAQRLAAGTASGSVADAAPATAAQAAVPPAVPSAVPPAVPSVATPPSPRAEGSP